MPTPIARFVVDTSVLLQCEDLPQLRWADVTDAEEIELYLANTVIMEIDRHKGDGNERRARRARTLSSRISELLSNSHERLLLRETAPRLSLLMAPVLDDADEQRILAHDLHDYRIVEEALLMAGHLGGIGLLTNDNLSLARASRKRLPTVRPPENWLLPPEPNKMEKRVAELERALKERGAPALAAELSAPDHDDWRFSRTLFGAPSNALVDGLCEIFTQQEMREAQRAVDQIQREFISPVTLSRPEDRLVDVRDWRERVRDWLTMLPDHGHMASRLQQFTLRISNDGAGPAENVRVVISARWNAILAASTASLYYWNADEQYLADARRAAPHFAIPELPADDPLGLAEAANWRADVAGRAPRERYLFHRTSKDDPDHTAHEIVFECDDFRHGGSEVYLHFAVFAGGAHPTGHVRAVVTASNAGAPIIAECEFTSVEEEGDIEELTEAMAKLWASGIEMNKARR